MRYFVQNHYWQFEEVDSSVYDAVKTGKNREYVNNFFSVNKDNHIHEIQCANVWFGDLYEAFKLAGYKC